MALSREQKISNLLTHELAAVAAFSISVTDALGETSAKLSQDTMLAEPKAGCIRCELPLEHAMLTRCTGSAG